MFRSRVHALFAILAAGLVLGAQSCTSWGPARTSARLTAQTGPHKVRVWLRGGEGMVVHRSVVDGDTLRGIRQVPQVGRSWLKVPVTIPLAHIDSVEIRRFDGAKTVVVVVAGFTVMAVAGSSGNARSGSSCSGADIGPLF